MCFANCRCAVLVVPLRRFSLKVSDYKHQLIKFNALLRSTRTWRELDTMGRESDPAGRLQTINCNVENVENQVSDVFPCTTLRACTETLPSAFPAKRNIKISIMQKALVKDH